MKPGAAISTIFTLLLAFLFSACTAVTTSRESAVEPEDSGACLNGFSGMANIDGDSYLAVHDKKAHNPGDRFSIIQTFSERNFTVTSVSISDWRHSDGPSSDLEAVCRIPQRENEFLAVESGHWDGKFGRLFHLKLNPDNPSSGASIIHAYDLPEFDSKGPDDPHGDELEGLECAAIDQDSVLVILGERGGSQAYTHGTLRWVTLDMAQESLNWDAAGKTGKTIDAPGVWVDNAKNRDITALYLDENHVLWAIASEDAGDAGPFKSLLYRIGTVSARESDPVRLFNSNAVTRRTDGLKVEALAGPSDAIPVSVYAIATEDECFGGVWRPLK